MALHRATLIGLGMALTAAVAAPAQTTTGTTNTMQSATGKNLLWLSAGQTTCPTGYTLVTVNTSTGPKKACKANSTSTNSMSTTTSTTPQ